MTIIVGVLLVVIILLAAGALDRKNEIITDLRIENSALETALAKANADLVAAKLELDSYTHASKYKKKPAPTQTH